MGYRVFQLEFKKTNSFWYFWLRVISFRKQNIPFRFIAKHAKLNFFSRYFALLIFVSVSLRFTSRNEGHPITHTTGQLQLSIVIDTAESRSVVSLRGFCFLLGMVVHQPFFLRPFILFYVNLCAHLETQSLWLKCFDLWQAGYNPTGSLLISLGSIEIVAFCIGRIFFSAWFIGPCALYLLTHVLCNTTVPCGYEVYDLSDPTPLYF